MQPVSYLVKEALPNYLSNLPIPNSVGGWFRLSFRDWLSLIPPTAVTAGLVFTLYRAYCPKGRGLPRRFNTLIDVDKKKVTDVFDVEEIGEKLALCRCWKSKKWPYCDGAHGPYNRATGDNLGPAVIKRKVEEGK